MFELFTHAARNSQIFLLYRKYFSIVGGWCHVCLQSHRACCSAEPACESCHYGPVSPIGTCAVGVLRNVDIQSSSSVPHPLLFILADFLEIFAYCLSLIFTVLDYRAERLNGPKDIILSISSLTVETRQNYRQVSL